MKDVVVHLLRKDPTEDDFGRGAIGSLFNRHDFRRISGRILSGISMEKTSFISKLSWNVFGWE